MARRRVFDKYKGWVWVEVDDSPVARLSARNKPVVDGRGKKLGDLSKFRNLRKE